MRKGLCSNLSSTAVNRAGQRCPDRTGSPAARSCTAFVPSTAEPPPVVGEHPAGIRQRIGERMRDIGNLPPHFRTMAPFLRLGPPPVQPGAITHATGTVSTPAGYTGSDHRANDITPQSPFHRFCPYLYVATRGAQKGRTGMRCPSTPLNTSITIPHMMSRYITIRWLAATSRKDVATVDYWFPRVEKSIWKAV